MKLGRQRVSLVTTKHRWYESWQNRGVGLVGGTLPSAWGSASGVGNGYTVLAIHAGFRQSCLITSITVSIVSNAGGTFKLKLFRYNEGTSLYDFISECPFTVSGTGTKTVTLSTPVSVTKGDIPGLYAPASHTFGWGLAGNEVPNFVRYDAAGGDITTSNTQSTEASSKNLFLGCYSKRPSVVLLGDSMMSYNGGAANFWYTSPYAGATGVKRVPFGSENGEIAKYLGLPGFLWQSLNETGKTMAHVADSQIDEAIGACPKYIIVHAGTNDISASRSWADYEANLNTILSKITTEILLITDISPRTTFNDTQAAIIRTWNANLATWCSTNDVQLISTHDIMAQIRTSTGELDDFIPAFTVDGLHYSIQAGVQKFADLIKPHLR